MSSTAPPAAEHAVAPVRANYGIDAPPVVRNLALGGAAALLLLATGSLVPWLRAPTLRTTLLFTAIAWLATAAAMVWSSRVGKLRLRDRVLDRLALRGDEQVLDVGCGRGLLLIGAAHRVPRGRAVGVDLWQTRDQSGNRSDETLANARAEGVAERVEVHTADMRQMPFADGSFDLAVSNLAIHNLPSAAARADAVREIARVVRPGGRVLLIDLLDGTRAYAATLGQLGFEEIHRGGLDFHIFPPVRVLTAVKSTVDS